MVQSIVQQLERIPMSANLAKTLTRAADFAHQKDHGEVTLEHLLLALTTDDDAQMVLTASQIDVPRLARELDDHLATTSSSGTSRDAPTAVAADLKRVLEAAAAAAQRGRRREINGAIVLAAIVGDGKSTAAQILRDQGLTFDEAIKALQRATQASRQPGGPAREPAAPLPEARAEPTSPVAAGSPAAPGPGAGQGRATVAPAPASPTPDPSTISHPSDAGVARRPGALNGHHADAEPNQRRPAAPDTAGAAPTKPAAAPAPARAAPPDAQPSASSTAPATATAGAGRTDGDSGVAGAAVSTARLPAGLADSAPVSPARAKPLSTDAAPAPNKPVPADTAPATPPAVASGQRPVPPPSPAGGPATSGAPGRPPPGDNRAIAPDMAGMAKAGGEAASPVPAASAPPRPQPAGPDAVTPAPPARHPPPMPPRTPPSPPPQQGAPSGGRTPPPFPPERAQPRPGPAPDRPAAMPPWSEDGHSPPPHPGYHQPAAVAPQPHAPAPSETRSPPDPAVRAQRPPDARKRRRAEGRTTGQLVENIPRTMRVAEPVSVEVRLARGQPEALARGMEGGAPIHFHELVVTRAMSIRLRAPDGGFLIDTASPETQWVDGVAVPDSESFASWRWTILPQRRGRQRLQLVVSARTIGPDGLTADTALPDQIIEVRVRTNYARTLMKVTGWAAAAAAGAILQALATPGAESALGAWRRLFTGG